MRKKERERAREVKKGLAGFSSKGVVVLIFDFFISLEAPATCLRRKVRCEERRGQDRRREGGSGGQGRRGEGKRRI